MNLRTMTAFVDSCVERVEASATAVVQRSHGRPHARHLLRQLADKKSILITAHEHPDPDALASVLGLCKLLESRLPGARVSASIKGRTGGGINTLFTQLMDLRLVPWDEPSLRGYDAIILLDVQPSFSNNPLPPGVTPAAVIDHHRSRGQRPACPFCDIRPDVGATGSIIFSYFMELEQAISPDLAAGLLFAIESDLAGAAGQPGELDNMALSSLTLVADTRKLYRMRYAPLMQSYYIAYAHAIGNAMVYDDAIATYLDKIDSPEKPAVMADFLLRYDKAQWALAMAVFNGRLVLSIRTNGNGMSAADLARRLVRQIGEGGGHRTKAGGSIPLASGTPGEIDRLRSIVRRRYLRALHIPPTRGVKLAPRE
jgi:nanoRNase/pAp phosphatase (c-di-AMP/oligoRNAs hydrolase)